MAFEQGGSTEGSTDFSSDIAILTSANDGVDWDLTPQVLFSSPKNEMEPSLATYNSKLYLSFLQAQDENTAHGNAIEAEENAVLISSFTNAGGDSVTFTSYLTGTNDEYNVQFFLSGDTIIHRMNTGVLSPADDKVIATDVTGLEFNYYDSATNLLGNPNGTLSSISLVEIEITMTLSSGETVMTESMETMVRVRR